MKSVDNKSNKLVRDRIPEYLRNLGIEVRERVVTNPLEHQQLLKDKLQEEASEAVLAENDHLLEELGDVLSVVYGLAHAHGFTDQQLNKQKKKKDLERGAFEKGIFLIETKETK